MDAIDPKTLWFNTVDSNTLCRGGGNGPEHPSQLYALAKYANPLWSILDFGCGSATTLEALINGKFWEPNGLLVPEIKYKGVDIIPKNIAWCKRQFPLFDWAVNKDIHKINQMSNSFDVVYSRHVVDHMKSFEKAMDEHCRVARILVIVVLWVPLFEGDTHIIKNIVDQPGLPTEKTYLNEYTNRYSREKVMQYLNNKKGWKLLELKEGIEKDAYSKSQGSACGNDVIIVLKHE